MSGVTTVGSNRICYRVIPDYLVVLDSTVEEACIPAVGELLGLITIETCKYATREDAISVQLDLDARVTPAMPGDPYIDCRNTAGVMFQWALELGATDIGIIGVDYNQRLLDRDQTHFYGVNGASPFGTPLDDHAVELWEILRDSAAARAVQVANLSPYGDSESPFHRVGFNHMDFDDWMKT